MKIYTPEQIDEKMKKRNKIKKISNCIVYPIIILIVVVNAILLVQKYKNPNKIANLFGFSFFAVTSGSMEPTLNVGDMVITRKVTENDINKSDVITFINGQNIITHRIAYIYEENGKFYYKTKGDANNVADEEKVSYGDIQGVYFFKIPKIGKILLEAQNNGVMLIVICCVVYLIYSVLSSYDDRRVYRHQKRLKLEKEADIIL